VVSSISSGVALVWTAPKAPGARPPHTSSQGTLRRAREGVESKVWGLLMVIGG